MFSACSILCCAVGSVALASPAFESIRSAPSLVHARTGSLSPLSFGTGKTLVVLLPQLGEFDSAEFVEQLVAVEQELEENDVALRVIGIGDATAAKRFCAFSGLSADKLYCDPQGALHTALGLHAGPGWRIPERMPDSLLTLILNTLPGGPPDDPGQLRPVATAWLNYMAMCAGIAAPGTLAEILRGYMGDRSAPERLASDAVVKAGPVEIGPGVGPVRIGPLRYSNPWAAERGYQRPVELATVRLRNMVEVIGNWNCYVSDPLYIAQRGATYLFDAEGTAEYEYRHRGVLVYSETMRRPLSFLTPYIGEARASNPLGLGDKGQRA